MKEFFKYVAATIVGIFGFAIIMAVFGLISLVGMITSRNTTTTIKDNSVLVLNLSGEIEEQAGDNLLAQLTGGDYPQQGLNDILTAINKAKNNDHIKGIYIETKGLINTYGTAKEIRDALVDFRQSGKWIIAYGDIFTQPGYYVASVADKVYINPAGELDWHGLGIQNMYIKDLAAKLGIKYQVLKVGTFKSATEAFTETKMSDANRLQSEAIVNGNWKLIRKEVGASRHLSVDSLNNYADQGLMLAEPKTLITKKLVDGMLYDDEVKGVVKKKLGIKDNKKIHQVSVEDILAADDEKDNGDDEIAVYYAQGEIIQSNIQSITVEDQDVIVADDVCKDLEDLADDKDVKAVVLRINSPGGDAASSERIWHAVTMLKAKKPVVVSMGDYAASGGYYISCNANWIVTQPTTLTGSIGIFGVIPDVSELGNKKLGLHWDEVQTNKYATSGNSLERGLNADELALIQGHINQGYKLFRKRVSDGRKLPVDQVEKIAQGHVWLGMDAIGIKLVDQLGGLNVAVRKAAQLAKVNSWYTKDYPAPSSLVDQIIKQAQYGNNLDETLRMQLGDYYQPFLLLKEVNQRRVMIEARMPFYEYK